MVPYWSVQLPVSERLASFGCGGSFAVAWVSEEEALLRSRWLTETCWIAAAICSEFASEVVASWVRTSVELAFARLIRA